MTQINDLDNNTMLYDLDAFGKWLFCKWFSSNQNEII